jgi:hypothetical protein
MWDMDTKRWAKITSFGGNFPAVQAGSAMVAGNNFILRGGFLGGSVYSSFVSYQFTVRTPPFSAA